MQPLVRRILLAIVLALILYQLSRVSKRFLEVTPILRSTHTQSSHQTSNMDEADIRYWEQKLVGKKVVKGKAPSEQVSENVVYSSQLPSSNRIIKPGDFVTMDYRPDSMFHSCTSW
ncbi:hypothetical protein BKA69DRAFT_1081787 [Paraphysoderma sedebokerense]|nr:hypothetical protein BKA69DRAFT_1081787 [Paraphysoderma sedebokerense]